MCMWSAVHSIFLSPRGSTVSAFVLPSDVSWIQYNTAILNPREDNLEDVVTRTQLHVHHVGYYSHNITVQYKKCNTVGNTILTLSSFITMKWNPIWITAKRVKGKPASGQLPDTNSASIRFLLVSYRCRRGQLNRDVLAILSLLIFLSRQWTTYRVNVF